MASGCFVASKIVSPSVRGPGAPRLIVRAEPAELAVSSIDPKPMIPATFDELTLALAARSDA